MNVQSVLGDMPVATFVGEYLHRLPLALTGSARDVCEYGTWEALGAILGAADVDVMVVRDGVPYAGASVAPATYARLSDEGYTILVRHAERHHAALAELARAFEATFLAPANVHIYATPPGRHGFSWHYDAEDVFIVQTAGEKEYSLRKNTVNPWPLEETLPQDMQYEREIMPLMRVLLRAGDLLYIPCGYWHRAEAVATGETAISLALGIMSPSAIEIYDFLRPRLVESLLWRQRVPVDGAAETLEVREAAYRELQTQLARELTRALTDSSLMEEFLESRREKYGRDLESLSEADEKSHRSAESASQTPPTG